MNAAAFAACLAEALGARSVDVPVPPDESHAMVVWGEWLAGRGFGFVPVVVGTARPTRGRIDSIWAAPAAESPMVSRERTEVDSTGLEGDRYRRGEGTFSVPGTSGRALTLVEAEALDAVGMSHGEARRNVVTRGIRLNDLVGRRFTVGEIECEGRRLCQPCAHLERLTRPGVLRALVHRGGLRADVLGPGRIAVGDAVVAQ